MAWHRLLARLALPCSLSLACGHDPDDHATTAASTTAAATEGTATTSTTAATSTAASEGSTAASEGSTAAADSTTAALEPVECGDLVCDPGQVCVVPCCGGPMPGCYEQPVGGDCGDGTPDEFGAQCCINDPTPTQCMMTSWCIPGPCVPDPPYCTAAETIGCTGSTCTVEGGCYGMLLEDGHLQCSCK